MTGLEQSLRDLFAEQAEQVPTVADAAGRAIRAARRRRRRRTLAGSLAGLLLVVAMTGVTTSVWQALQSSSTGGGTGVGPYSPILPPERPMAGQLPLTAHRGGSVDFRLVNEVFTPDGQRVLLSGLALVDEVYRTPYGLLHDERDRLMLRWNTGESRLLVDGVSEWLIDRDASHLAYVSGGTAVVTPLTVEGLGQPTTVAVPKGTIPVAFWGDRLFLRLPDDGGLRVWDVPTARLEPVDDRVEVVYGPVEDGLLVLFRYPGQYCLALLDDSWPPAPVDLRTGCRAGLNTDEPGWLSPNGQWLALPAKDALVLVSVLSLDGPQADAVAEEESTPEEMLRLCPRYGNVVPVWSDATSILTADADGPVRCTVEGEVYRLQLPDTLTKTWQYVPTVG